MPIDQIPAEVKAKAIRHTLDSLGVAVSGAMAAEFHEMG